MHRCAAKCCDDPDSSLERVHGCIERCTAPLNQANNYVQVREQCLIVLASYFILYIVG